MTIGTPLARRSGRGVGGEGIHENIVNGMNGYGLCAKLVNSSITRSGPGRA